MENEVNFEAYIHISVKQYNHEQLYCFPIARIRYSWLLVRVEIINKKPQIPTLKVNISVLFRRKSNVKGSKPQTFTQESFGDLCLENIYYATDLNFKVTWDQIIVLKRILKKFSLSKSYKMLQYMHLNY